MNKDGYEIAWEQIKQMLCDEYPLGDIIALIEFKYDYETKYELEWEFISVDNEGMITWQNDWCEGQTDVNVVKCGYVGDIKDITFYG